MPLLALVRLSRGNQPDEFTARRIGDYKKPPFYLAEGEPPFLTVVTSAALTVQPVRVQKHPYRVFERYAVFSDILCGLAVIPFEWQLSL